MTTLPPVKKTWLWIMATPPLLIVLLIIAISFDIPIPFGFQVVMASFVLSILVGVIALVALIVLRGKNKITLSPRAFWLSIVLACLDIAIPVALIAFFIYLLSSVRFAH